MRADSFLVRAEGALKTALRLQEEQSRCWQGVIDWKTSCASWLQSAPLGKRVRLPRKHPTMPSRETDARGRRRV